MDAFELETALARLDARQSASEAALVLLSEALGRIAPKERARVQAELARAGDDCPDAEAQAAIYALQALI